MRHIPRKRKLCSRRQRFSRSKMEILAIKSHMMSGDTLLGDGHTQLTGDLMMLIILRLPVESVLSFKSVCRAWRALFNTPMFIKRHCQMAISCAKLNNPLSFLLHVEMLGNAAPIFYVLVERSCGKRTSISLNPPFKCDLFDIQVVGCINGLVCFNFFLFSSDIVLWNPATGKYRKIPTPLMLLAKDEADSFGFAYDETSDTYKVIRILRTNRREGYSIIVEIYDTGSDTWRAIAFDFPWVIHQKICFAVVSGSPYWSAIELDPPKQYVVWFDPLVDDLRSQPMPFEDILSDTVLGAVGDCPVVYSKSFRMGRDETVKLIDVWKMNKFKDGVGHPIFQEKATIEIVSDVDLNIVLGVRGSGEIIVLSKSMELYLCDSHSIQRMITHDRYVVWGTLPKIYDYTESLVSPAFMRH